MYESLVSDCKFGPPIEFGNNIGLGSSIPTSQFTPISTWMLRSKKRKISIVFLSQLIARKCPVSHNIPGLTSRQSAAVHAVPLGMLAGDNDMTSQQQPPREEFNRLAELLKIQGEPDYMDDLYDQVRGVFMMGESIRSIDVSGAEPDMAFIPPST